MQRAWRFGGDEGITSLVIRPLKISWCDEAIIWVCHRQSMRFRGHNIAALPLMKAALEPSSSKMGDG